MRVRILARQAGTPDEPGDVRDVPETEARALVDAGRAEYADVPVRPTKRVQGAAVETAAAPPRTERRG